MKAKPHTPESVSDFLARGGEIERLSHDARGRPLHPTQHTAHADVMGRIRADKLARARARQRHAG